MCLYSALSTSGEDSKRSSDNLSLFALLSSISGPLLGLYLSAAIAAHIQICQSTCQVQFYLNEVPSFCLHGSTVRDVYKAFKDLQKHKMAEHKQYL